VAVESQADGDERGSAGLHGTVEAPSGEAENIGSPTLEKAD
jgi:hypothetical protein